ncbi:AraC family transcriptional regulator [Chimaeribacter arupi]|uniref:AraC family transcriptional regulator n=1 Tax=Nissabacter archeti TaxID=1917880 RepID=A0ABS5JKC6_9GAMM|nr:AraC family transcriptional regulator [Chimaeribacter arupi]MBS0970405.1 AraC family transcriptional regulator [Nissabacter archeti]PLR37700.1 AraC family transcriptional regulator [Chimaeribacter arupi]WKZ92066.1 AraC family transcriptional regulator [Chimaeribacter arupi]
MQGVPEQFECETDQAQFRQLSGLPGVELYRAHISRHVFEPHTHEAFGIGTIEAGAERFRYRGVQHVAGPGSLVLMNPDELHTGQAETDEGWRYRMIYIDPATLATLSGEPGWWFSHEAVRRDPRTAQQLAMTLAALWQSNDALAADGLMLSLVDLLRPHARRPLPPPPDAAHRFDRVKACLHARFAEPLTLAELAAEAALSPYHFQRQFKAHFHVTPHQMLMAIRLYRAKLLLAAGVSAAQVAADVGLTDQAHLTRAFATRYGVTPVRYQRAVMRR